MKKIEKSLRRALLENGEMSMDLYKFELEEYIESWSRAARKDKDEFTYAITENQGAVAMLVITKNGEIHINEAGREKLKELFRKGYEINIQLLLPAMAHLLYSGEIFVNGVKLKTS